MKEIDCPTPVHSGLTLKKFKIPSDLIDKFEQVSGRNMARRKETGGLLLASDQGSHYLVL